MDSRPCAPRASCAPTQTLLCSPQRTLASIQGGLVLTQTRRAANQLRVALDAARTHVRAFAS
jgi:hypothetical protein